MYIELGNQYYFIYILITSFILLGLYFILRNKSEKIQKRVLFSILVAAFVVHFLKYFIYPYTTIEPVARIRKVSFENISATHTLLFPFVFLSNKRVLKDYMVLGGIVSGLVPILYPLDAMAATFDGNYFPIKEAFSLEVIRFYFAHIAFLIIGVLTPLLGIHRVNIETAYRTLFVLLGVFLVLFINEVILTAFGLVPKEDLFNQDGRNPSFIFGIRTDVLGDLGFLHRFAPKFMYMQDGEYKYWPVLWLVGPVFFIGGFIVFILCLIIDYRKTIDLFKHKVLRMKVKSEEADTINLT